MDMAMKMNQVIRFVKAGGDTDPDWDKVDKVKEAIRKFNLDEEETRYLCRRFSLLTEDIRT